MVPAPPDPPLVDPSDRFHLRPWEVADAPALAAAWADAEIARWCAVPDARTLEHAGAWIAGWAQRAERDIALDLVIAAPEDDRVLGEVGLRPLTRPRGQPGGGAIELGWWLVASARGAGIAADAVALVTTWLRGEAGGDRVVARIPSGHTRSERVAAAAGLVRRGPLPDGRMLWAGESSGAVAAKLSF
jgi:RimJ/RimL family protein N-acetyltransferase